MKNADCTEPDPPRTHMGQNIDGTDTERRSTTVPNEDRTRVEQETKTKTKTKVQPRMSTRGLRLRYGVGGSRRFGSDSGYTPLS